MNEEIPVILQWMEFLDWFVEVSAKFPRKVRWSLTTRLEDHGFDILECLVTAKYETGKTKKMSILRDANLKLDLMRLLLRHSHRKQYLSGKAHQRCSRDINEVGQMIGGWLKSLSGIS